MEILIYGIHFGSGAYSSTTRLFYDVDLNVFCSSNTICTFYFLSLLSSFDFPYYLLILPFL